MALSEMLLTSLQNTTINVFKINVGRWWYEYFMGLVQGADAIDDSSSLCIMQYLSHVASCEWKFLRDNLAGGCCLVIHRSPQGPFTVEWIKLVDFSYILEGFRCHPTVCSQVDFCKCLMFNTHAPWHLLSNCSCSQVYLLIYCHQHCFPGFLYPGFQ